MVVLVGDASNCGFSAVGTFAGAIIFSKSTTSGVGRQV